MAANSVDRVRALENMVKALDEDSKKYAKQANQERVNMNKALVAGNKRVARAYARASVMKSRAYSRVIEQRSDVEELIAILRSAKHRIAVSDDFSTEVYEIETSVGDEKIRKGIIGQIYQECEDNKHDPKYLD